MQIPFKYISNTFKIPFKHLSNKFQIPFKYLSNTFHMPFKYTWNIFQIRFKYISNTFQIPFKYLSHAFQIHLKYISNTFQIHFKYLSNAFLMSCYFIRIFVHLPVIVVLSYFSNHKLGLGPANIQLFKFNSRNTRKRYETCPMLTINTMKSRSDVFTVKCYYCWLWISKCLSRCYI